MGWENARRSRTSFPAFLKLATGLSGTRSRRALARLGDRDFMNSHASTTAPDPRRWQALAVSASRTDGCPRRAIVNRRAAVVQKSLHFSDLRARVDRQRICTPFGGFLLCWRRSGDLLGRRRVSWRGLGLSPSLGSSSSALQAHRPP